MKLITLAALGLSLAAWADDVPADKDLVRTLGHEVVFHFDKEDFHRSEKVRDHALNAEQMGKCWVHYKESKSTLLAKKGQHIRFEQQTTVKIDGCNKPNSAKDGCKKSLVHSFTPKDSDATAISLIKCTSTASYKGEAETGYSVGDFRKDLFWKFWVSDAAKASSAPVAKSGHRVRPLD